LTLSLLSYALGHALCALAPSYAALVPLRILSVLGAAVFTPQAAAAIGTMAPPEHRGRAITFIFLGWSLASVVGMPVHSYIGETFGWRYAFLLVALLATAGAVGVWRAMPAGVRPPAMNLGEWREVVTHPVLMAIVLVTALSGAGQFTVFSYFAPYYRQVLGASAGEVSFLFFWFGAFGLLGNMLLSRHIDRVGPARAVTWLLSAVGLSLALWPLAGNTIAMAVVSVPWALGCFASNSAQQARLGLAAPALAPALMALNTSAIYLGQAVGAAGGGAIVAATGFGALAWVGLAWVLVALALSQWAGRRLQPRPAHA
jgi:predicted MFS family arabinose efflux permease